MNYLGGSHGSSASDFGSTNNSLATTMPGWTEDLQNLDLETQKLLASVRGDDKPKKPPKKESDPNARSSGYGSQPSTKKRRARGPARELRDDAVRDARDAGPHATRAVAEANSLTFGAQEATIRDGSDSCPRSACAWRPWPRSGSACRSSRANAEQAVAQAYAATEKTARSHRLKEDMAALNVQRAFRGRIGRRLHHLKRDESELQAAIEKRWVEVCDRETGESWYFNTLTHTSQWDAPDALEGVVPSGDEVVTLPPVHPPPERDDDDDRDGSIRPSSSSLSEARELASAYVEVDLPDGAPGDKVELLHRAMRKTNVGPLSSLADSQRILRDTAGGGGDRSRAATGLLSRSASEPIVSALPPGPGASLYDGEGDDLANPSVRGGVEEGGINSHFVLPDGSMSSVETGTINQDTREPIMGSDKTMMAAVSVLESNKQRIEGKRSLEGKYKHRDKTMAIRDITHDGFDIDEIDATKTDDPFELLKQSDAEREDPGAGWTKQIPSKICFNCWSSGKRHCALHADEDEAKLKSASESSLMCQNWDLAILERRYRSEEIQELFQKSVSSLRYDQERKTFVATVEQKHPIYRAVFHHVARCNFTMRRKLHQRTWILSLVEELRCGHIKVEGAAQSGKMLQLRNSLMNHSFVKSYTRKTAALRPLGPVTGTSLPERTGAAVYLAKARADDEHYSYIRSPPVPFPVKLFEPVVYNLPAPRTIPMPEPDYSFEGSVLARNNNIPEDHIAAWFERLSGAVSRDAVNAAAAQIHTLSPVPGMELLRRTKYPSPHTVKFATFSRKPTPGNKAVGGLAAELTVYQLVQAVIPPQFGNFTVMERQAIVSEVSPEITASFETYDCPPVTQHFERELQHRLNNRISPTVCIATPVLRGDRHYFGLNRPSQTGEEHDLGFRTSAHAAGFEFIVLTTTELQSFTPSTEIAAPNMPAANTTTTTHVDHSYPFCEPSSRNNTTLDFYHLLLVDHCSPNKEQVFTNLGVQQCGQFMHGCDRAAPMGQFVSLIYRSWGFVQRNHYEEFRTDDGIAYWYNRRTGETFWERPLADCEKLSVMEGGVAWTTRTTRDPKWAGIQRPTHEVRSLILKHHEDSEELETRRGNVAYDIETQRDKGKLPPRSREDVKVQKRMSLEELSAKNRNIKKGPSAGLDASGRATEKGHVEERKPPTPGAPPAVPELPLGGRPGTGASRPSTAAARRRGAAAETMASAVAAALLPAMQSGGDVSALLKAAVGLGMGLGANNPLFAVPEPATPGFPASPPKTAGSPSRSRTPPPEDFAEVEDVGPEGRMDAKAVAGARRVRPGPSRSACPSACPTRRRRTRSWTLPTRTRSPRGQARSDGAAPLSTTDIFQGVDKVELSPPPDEELPQPIVFLGDRKSDIENTVPVVAYPELLAEREAMARGYDTHGVAGLGDSFVDYLPWIPNLPQARPIGRIKPRPAAEDWLAVGFDPWSAGKEPLAVEFIGSLSAKAEQVLDNPPNKADDSFIDVMDRHGLAAQEAEAAQANKMSDDFAQLASWARHSRYKEIENAMNQPDWLLPIDYQDELGNTLLSVAVQNGNKRIAKLTLRRGANINLPNNNGQTVLHAPTAQDIAEYAKSRARTTARRADGLTCYGGSMQEIEAI
ncbi:hypothetical protein JL721_2311 [Aureococcus anophagefferens]|nr:hypothetical protein JL721_2311 [Aureococcus anophagefferens]